MSDRIRGRPPGAPGDIPRGVEGGEPTDKAGQPQAPTTADPGKQIAKDSFERAAAQDRVGGQVGPQLEKLQALAGKGAVGKVQFTNEDLAYLANTFAMIIKQNPNASRLKRARLFTKAILKRKRFRKVFAGVPESELEGMYDIIGEQLDSSPVFGQLVDDVTDGARKHTAT